MAPPLLVEVLPVSVLLVTVRKPTLLLPLVLPTRMAPPLLEVEKPVMVTSLRLTISSLVEMAEPVAAIFTAAVVLFGATVIVMPERLNGAKAVVLLKAKITLVEVLVLPRWTVSRLEPGPVMVTPSVRVGRAGRRL